MNNIPSNSISSAILQDNPEEPLEAPPSALKETHEEDTSAEAPSTPATQTELSGLADTFNPGPQLASGPHATQNAPAANEASPTSHTQPQAQSAGSLTNEALKIGAFSGSWASGKDSEGKAHNSVDLHVVGQLGQSMNKDDLRAYLQTANALMQSHQEESGTKGELEWHPTGAVVTKGAVQLLSESLGGKTVNSSFNKFSARANNLWRKNMPSSAPPQRDKLAERIDKDVQPEYFSYLKSLKGVQGLSMTPLTMERNKVAGFDQLSEDDQAKAFDQNMLENSDWGKQRFAQYEKEYKENPDFVPSLRIKVDQQHLPALISTLEKVK